MIKQRYNIFETLDEAADKYEPWAAGVALTGSAVGLGTAMTGFGAPAGAAIAFGSSIPSTAIDIYQTGRDWYKVINSDDKPIGSALWNSFETGIDLLGLKGLKYLKNVSADKKFAKELAIRAADEKARRKGQEVFLRKKGMSDLEIGMYLGEKAANAATNSKDMIDRKKSLRDKAIRDAIKYNYTISSIPNTIDIVYPQLSDGSYLLPEISVMPYNNTLNYLNYIK